jgi:hypothetical protein
MSLDEIAILKEKSVLIPKYYPFYQRKDENFPTLKVSSFPGGLLIRRMKE